jgi:Mycothiol maleylpyruvate isomerase N-terminal domain
VMGADRSYVAENEAQLTRLRTLVDTSSDEGLAEPMPAGWTVAGVLAHAAFWDQRIVTLLERWGADGKGQPPDSPGSYHEEAEWVDWINDATKPLILALPPRIAAQVAVDIASTADARVAELSDELLAENERTGGYINVSRAEHRREHLDEIEQARSRR